MGCSRSGTPHPFLLGAKQQLASLQQGAGKSRAPTESLQSPVPHTLLVTASSHCHLSWVLCVTSPGWVLCVTSLMPFQGAAASVTHGLFRGGQNDP